MHRLLKAYWLDVAAVVVVAASVVAIVYLALGLLSVPTLPPARPMADDPLTFRAGMSGMASSRRFASRKPRPTPRGFHHEKAAPYTGRRPR